MIVATFNINGVNTRLANLLEWLEATQPDVVCLQELKAPSDRFPESALRDAGCHCVWAGEARWNGVAIASRLGLPVITRKTLPGDPGDNQSRYIEAAVGGWLIGSLYLPNGNPCPGAKFDYKMAWLERLLAHARTLMSLDAPVVLAGDFNVVPTDADIYDTRSWKANALLQPEPRAAFAELLADGWTDALAERYPHDPQWTFWAYLRKSWERDAGLRIDHLLLNSTAASRLLDAGVDRDVRGQPGASDHAPVWVEVS